VGSRFSVRITSDRGESGGEACPGKGTTNAHEVGIDTRYIKAMARKASVVIEKDEHGFYAWCPKLKGCQSQGNTLEETVANIKEAIELP
jgi:hypothetical protein